MRLAVDQIDDDSLIHLGEEASRFLSERQTEKLAAQFGYALAFGNDPVEAIQSDLRSALLLTREDAKISSFGNPKISIRRFNPDASALRAVVECFIPIQNAHGNVLMELVLSNDGQAHHLTLEQISFSD